MMISLKAFILVIVYRLFILVFHPIQHEQPRK